MKEAVELHMELEGSMVEARRDFIGVQFLEVPTSESKTASC